MDLKDLIDQLYRGVDAAGDPIPGGGIVALRRKHRFRWKNKLSAAIVDECIQTAFEKVFETYRDRGEEFQHPGDLLPLIQTSIRHAIIDQYRRDFSDGMPREIGADPEFLDVIRESQSSGWRDPDGPAPSSQALSSPGAMAPAPEARLEDLVEDEMDAKSLMTTVLSRLDERYRSFVVLLLQDLTPAEIARLLGIDPGQVYVLRRWARTKVCRILEQIAALGDLLAGRIHHQGCS